ncbi:unnamed protein product [Coccothraustes coccothraustes]
MRLAKPFGSHMQEKTHISPLALPGSVGHGSSESHRSTWDTATSGTRQLSEPPLHTGHSSTRDTAAPRATGSHGTALPQLPPPSATKGHSRTKTSAQKRRPGP